MSQMQTHASRTQAHHLRLLDHRLGPKGKQCESIQSKDSKVTKIPYNNYFVIWLVGYFTRTCCQKLQWSENVGDISLISGELEKPVQKAVSLEIQHISSMMSRQQIA